MLLTNLFLRVKMLGSLLCVCLLISVVHCGPEEAEGVKYADKCEGYILLFYMRS